MLEENKVYNYKGKRVVYQGIDNHPQRRSFINYIKIGSNEMIEEMYGSDKNFIEKNGEIKIFGNVLLWFYPQKPSNSFLSKIKSLRFQKLKSIYFNALEKLLEIKK